MCECSDAFVGAFEDATVGGWNAVECVLEVLFVEDDGLAWLSFAEALGVIADCFVAACADFIDEFEYPELLDCLMKTKIGGFAVEFGRSNYDPAVLGVCKDRLVMFGCIDPGTSPPPAVGVVVDRVRAALNYVDPAKMLLAPDCGLMTINRDLARVKARLLVEAARQLRKTL